MFSGLTTDVELKLRIILLSEMEPEQFMVVAIGVFIKRGPDFETSDYVTYVH
jgi:hypothetical protein